jgi:F0F1-type ATP synthase epsilon subunit
MKIGDWIIDYEVDPDTTIYWQVEQVCTVNGKEGQLGVRFRNGSCWTALEYVIVKPKKENLKIFRAEFAGVYSVGNCLVLAAYNQEEAEEMARKTITHTNEIVVNEMTINEPQVIEYLSGDY